MKTILAVAALAAASALPSAALAQEALGGSSIGNARFVAVGASNHVTFDDIVGRPVQASDGRVGVVRELLIDRARIAALVVESGGKQVAVNYDRFSDGMSRNGGPALVLDRSVGTLADAPAFLEYRDAPASAAMELVR
jgi:hypothetical protein